MLPHSLHSHKQSKEITNAIYQKSYADSHPIQPQATRRDEQIQSVRKDMLTHILKSPNQPEEISKCRVSEKTY